MDILHYRPLFALCSAFMLAAPVGLWLPAEGKLTLGILLLAAAGVLTVFRLRRRDVYHSVMAVVAALLACIALLSSHLTFHGEAVTRLQALEGDEVTVCGTVTDLRGKGESITSYAITLTSVDGVETQGKALLTCSYTSTLRPGYDIQLTATVVSLAEIATDGYSVTALRGDGYVVGLLSEDEASVSVLRDESQNVWVRIGSWRRTLAARLNLMTGRGSGGLPSALLLGDRTALDDSVRRDFARTGVSHLLAISGLHMTLLFGLLEVLLRLIRVPRRWRAVLLALCALGYLTLIGYPPSATRAVIMLGVTYLSYLLSARADPLTSLGVAGALILAVTPYAVADAGFWMSYLSALGLITFSPFLNVAKTKEEGKRYQRLFQSLRRIGAALLVGVVATSFTLTVVAAVIGEMSLLSPLMTTLLTPLCAPVLILSLIALPCFGTGFGTLLGSVIELICALMYRLAGLLAKPSWVVVSLRHPAVLPILAVMLISLLVLLALRLPVRYRRVVGLPLLAGWVALGGLLAADAYATRNEVDFSYIQPSSQSESMVMVSGASGFVCDLSNGSLSALSAAALEAERQGATELSALMLTHYHVRTSGALAVFLQRETVRALWLPTPASEEQYDLLLACIEKAEAADVPVYLYDYGETLRIFGEGSITVESTAIDRSVHPLLLVTMSTSSREDGCSRVTYCGGAVFESDLAGKAAAYVPASDVLIFGSHGPVIKADFGATLAIPAPAPVILSAQIDPTRLDPEALPRGLRPTVGDTRLTLERD